LAIECPERPTLKDVARLAGVHPATASRALSGSRTVSPEHARAVQRAARSLNYHVNPIGRALKRRATSTIGMIVPDIENPFFPAMVRNVERALDREGFGLLLCDADNSVEVEAQRMDALLRRQVDSLIISSVHAQDSRKAVLRAAAEVPVVQVDRIVDASTDAVEVDQHGAIEAVVDHLRSTGRRRFAFVTSGEPISPIRGRLDAYRDILAADRAAQRRIYVGDLTLAWGTEAATRMLAGPDPVPDAVICANDLIAVGVMQTLRRAGVDVPGDTAVTGIDDTAVAEIAEPSLTTVRQPIEQIGDEAVRMMLSRLREADCAPRRLMLSPRLVVRESTGPRGPERVGPSRPG
jgi:LacI family transcriptional regulator